MFDYADNLVGLLDELALDRVALYGFHTGASQACAFALRYPERVAWVGMNGLTALTPPERREILARYLPAWEPRWDGSHLAWLWARLREQTIFFPWYEKGADHRMAYDVPGPGALTNAVIDFMRAGEEYRSPYEAAFRFDAAYWLNKVATPAEVFAVTRDPLFPHLQRLRESGAGLPIQVLEDPAVLADKLAANAAQHGAHESNVATLKARCRGASVRYAGTAGAQVRLATNGSSTSLPLILLHDRREDLDCITPALQGFHRHAAIAIELPGHGESDPATAETLTAYAGAVAAAVKELGIVEFDVFGRGLGARVALELQRTQPQVRRCAILQPPPDSAALAAEHDRFVALVAPDLGGGHLLRLWHSIRDEYLFDPGSEATRAHIVVAADAPLAAALTLRVRAALRAGARAAGTCKMLANFRADPSLPAYAASCRRVERSELPDELETWGDALLRAMT